jgi:hypothetical protein
MWNTPSPERLALIPRLYETEDIPIQAKLIYLHFFVAGCDWYIAEYCEQDQDTMWGYCVLYDNQFGEWGYVSLNELQSIKVAGFLEVDCELEDYWRIRPAIEVETIRTAHGWQYPPSTVSTRVETRTT